MYIRLLSSVKKKFWLERFMDLPRHQSRSYGINANGSSFKS